MQGTKYAVLDVETTTGDPSNGRVMEVAVIAMDGTVERARWESLVYPRSSVPTFVRKLTGIDNAMLVPAPAFTEVVRTIATLTQDRIVVAHNVRFDMTALSHEFARTGLVFERSTLCTERLSRRLLPQQEHFNLRSLCRYLGIEITKAHRAMPDAEATAGLLRALTDRFGEEEVLLSAVPLVVAMRA